MLMSLTLRNELLTGAEHGKAELLNHSLIGFSFRIGSQGERLTEAFNFCNVLYQKAVY
jgi:hypothetical protein